MPPDSVARPARTFASTWTARPARPRPPSAAGETLLPTGDLLVAVGRKGVRRIGHLGFTDLRWSPLPAGRRDGRPCETGLVP